MKKLIVFTLSLLFSCNIMAQESASYRFTLEDCIRFAFANSYERQSMALTGKSLEATYEQSKLQRLPNLSASIGQNISNNSNGWSSSGNVGVGSTMTIYQGGSIAPGLRLRFQALHDHTAHLPLLYPRRL